MAVRCCLGALCVAALAGCSGPVTIDTDDLSTADRAACQAVLDDLPDELAREGRRELEPTDTLGAAYGDPAIVVTCRDSAPAGFDDTSPCEQVNDVGWFVPSDQVGDPGATAVLTAMTHRPFVELVVPADYRPDGAAAALSELSDPISDNLELVDECL